MIHFDSDVLTWQPLVEVWLKSRPGIERTCLKEQFGIFMDPVVRAVCHSRCGEVIPVHCIGTTDPEMRTP